MWHGTSTFFLIALQFQAEEHAFNYNVLIKEDTGLKKQVTTDKIKNSEQGIKNGETKIHSGIHDKAGARNPEGRSAHQRNCIARKHQPNPTAKLKEPSGLPERKTMSFCCTTPPGKAPQGGRYPSREKTDSTVYE